MNPQARMRNRISTVLHMVMAFVIMILLAQLWLFTVVLEEVQSAESSFATEATAVVLSLLGCGGVWQLIRYFTIAEKSQ